MRGFSVSKYCRFAAIKKRGENFFAALRFKKEIF
jgi:hypothetical protein